MNENESGKKKHSERNYIKSMSFSRKNEYFYMYVHARTPIDN